jgi:hypothetical protein
MVSTGEGRSRPPRVHRGLAAAAGAVPSSDGRYKYVPLTRYLAALTIDEVTLTLARVRSDSTA